MADVSSYYPSLPTRPPTSTHGTNDGGGTNGSIMRRRGSYPPSSDFKTEAEMIELKRQAIAKTGPMVIMVRLEHHLREARGRVSWAINAYFRELAGRDVYPVCTTHDSKNGSGIAAKREVRPVSAFRNEFDPVPLAFAPAADGKAFKVHTASTAPPVAVVPTSAPDATVDSSHITNTSSTMGSLPLPAIAAHVMLPLPPLPLTGSSSTTSSVMMGTLPIMVDAYAPATMASPGATLPMELLWRIFSMLQPGIVTCNASLVNRHWRDCSSDDGLWEIWFWRRYRNGVPIGPLLPSSSSSMNGGQHSIGIGPRRLNHGDARPLVVFSFLSQPPSQPQPVHVVEPIGLAASPAVGHGTDPTTNTTPLAQSDPAIAMFQTQAQGDELRAATRHYFARPDDDNDTASSTSSSFSSSSTSTMVAPMVTDNQWLRLFRQRWDCERYRRCPLRECSGGSHVSGAVVPVIYGFPSTPLVDAARNGRLSMGLDHIPVGPWELPVWACKWCSAKWMDYPWWL